MESEIMVALCNVQWFFFLFHQIFFALVPGLMLRYEMILGNPQSGKEVCNRGRGLSATI
jgi:hypothetical protein